MKETPRANQAAPSQQSQEAAKVRSTEGKKILKPWGKS